MEGKDWAALITGLAGTGVGAYMANRNGRRQQESDADTREQNENRDIRDVALRESALDPFRHQRSQLQNLTSLDMLRQFGSGGRRVTPPSNVAPYTGQVHQGFRPGASLMGSIDALEQSVRGGNTAPTMTDPANFGRTSAVNINAATGQPGAGGVGAPGAPGAAGVQRRAPGSYLPGQEARRNEGAGGALSGMVKGATTGGTIGAYVGGVGAVPGALIGGAAGLIGGAFTKNAKTAKTDLSLEQAQQVLREVYETELGRTPSDEEVMGRITGTGFKPGHKWVGEQGLLYHIAEIQNSVEARQRQYGAAA